MHLILNIKADAVKGNICRGGECGVASPPEGKVGSVGAGLAPALNGGVDSQQVSSQ